MPIETGSYGGQAGNGGGNPFQHATRMVDEARAFSSALGQSANRFQQTLDLSGRVQRNPLLMVAAAAGVGYVLGGGLFSPLTGKLVRYGVRLALIPFVKSQLNAIAAGAQGADTMPGL